MLQVPSAPQPQLALHTRRIQGRHQHDTETSHQCETELVPDLALREAVDFGNAGLLLEECAPVERLQVLGRANHELPSGKDTLLEQTPRHIGPAIVGVGEHGEHGVAVIPDFAAEASHADAFLARIDDGHVMAQRGVDEMKVTRTRPR